MNCSSPISTYLSFIQLEDLDPFLLFEEFSLSRPNGFIDHPHRGFESVSEFGISFPNILLVTNTIYKGLYFNHGTANYEYRKM